MARLLDLAIYYIYILNLLKHTAIYCCSQSLDSPKAIKKAFSEAHYVDNIIFLLARVFIRIVFRKNTRE